MFRNDNCPNKKRSIPGIKSLEMCQKIALNPERITEIEIRQDNTSTNRQIMLPQEYKLHISGPEDNIPRHRVNDAIKTSQRKFNIDIIHQRSLNNVRLWLRFPLPII